MATSKDRLVAIETDVRFDEPDFIAAKCEALAKAVGIYARIYSHNPVYGTKESKPEEFVWAEDIRIEPPEVRAEPYQDFVQDYLGYFGPIRSVSLVPNLSIYQSDKAFCLERFPRPHE